jgi:hypothetical protein
VTLSPAKAAKQWLEVDETYREAKRLRDEAEKTLKPHFREKGLTRYRGITYACSTFTGFDIPTARQLLGNKASQAEVTRTRETLSAAA